MNWIVVAATCGATVSAIAIIIAIGKLLKFIATVTELHPTIVAMAKEFKTNSGSSLKDQIDRLEQMARDANATAALSREAAELARVVATHQTAIIETIRVEIIRQGLLKEIQVPT